MWSHYGHGTGWTHELSENSWPAMHDQLRTYRMNCPGAQFRAIKKRVRIEKETPPLEGCDICGAYLAPSDSYPWHYPHEDCRAIRNPLDAVQKTVI